MGSRRRGRDRPLKRWPFIAGPIGILGMGVMMGLLSFSLVFGDGVFRVAGIVWAVALCGTALLYARATTNYLDALDRERQAEHTVRLFSRLVTEATFGGRLLVVLDDGAEPSRVADRIREVEGVAVVAAPEGRYPAP